jgi:hypothetical protein
MKPQRPRPSRMPDLETYRARCIRVSDECRQQVGLATALLERLNFLESRFGVPGRFYERSLEADPKHRTLNVVLRDLRSRMEWHITATQMPDGNVSIDEILTERTHE